MTSHRCGWYIGPALIVSALVVSALLSLGMAQEEVPDPRLKGACVLDAADVLAQAEEGLIQQDCDALKKSKGYELVVISVDNLAGVPVESYATSLFNRLGIGSGQKNDGILVLFARDDREIRLEVGAGLDTILNDDVSGKLLDAAAIPFFKKSQYGQGLSALTRAITVFLEKGIVTSPLKKEILGGVHLEVPEEGAGGKEARPPVAEEKGSSGGFRKRLSRSNSLLVILIILGTNLSLMPLEAILRTRKARRQRSRKDYRSVAENTEYLIRPFSIATVVAAILVLCFFKVRHFGTTLSLIFIVPLLWLFASHLMTRFILRRSDAFAPRCLKCGTKMTQVPADDLEAILSREELLEQRAKGRSFEVWRCGACAALEKSSTIVEGSIACPVCGLYSVVDDATWITQATYHQGGRKKVHRRCIDESCTHDETFELDVKQLERKGDVLPCPSCGRIMDKVGEAEDDARLRPEEIAEEKAGGMNYEFFVCGDCGFIERFETKMTWAAACPKCGRRTLVTGEKTLVPATYESSGTKEVQKACRNPSCTHVERSTASIPKLKHTTYRRSSRRSSSSIFKSRSSSSFRSSSSSRSGSSSSSRSSSSSGGRSRGGGSSRKW